MLASLAMLCTLILWYSMHYILLLLLLLKTCMAFNHFLYYFYKFVSDLRVVPHGLSGEKSWVSIKGTPFPSGWAEWRQELFNQHPDCGLKPEFNTLEVLAGWICAVAWGRYVGSSSHLLIQEVWPAGGHRCWCSLTCEESAGWGSNQQCQWFHFP